MPTATPAAEGGAIPVEQESSRSLADALAELDEQVEPEPEPDDDDDEEPATEPSKPAETAPAEEPAEEPVEPETVEHSPKPFRMLPKLVSKSYRHG